MAPVFAPFVLLSVCASIALGAPQVVTVSDDVPETLASSASSVLGSISSVIATATATASGFPPLPSDDECPTSAPLNGSALPTTAFASGSTIYFLPVQTVTVTYYPSSCPPTVSASILPSFSSGLSGSASAVTLRPTAFTTRPTGLINSEDVTSFATPSATILASVTSSRAASGLSSIASSAVTGIPIISTPLATYVVPGGGDLVEYHCYPAPTTVASTCGFTTATPITLVRPTSTASGSIPMFSTVTLSEVVDATSIAGSASVRPTASGDL